MPRKHYRFVLTIGTIILPILFSHFWLYYQNGYHEVLINKRMYHANLALGIIALCLIKRNSFKFPYHIIISMSIGISAIFYEHMWYSLKSSDNFIFFLTLLPFGITPWFVFPSLTFLITKHLISPRNTRV
jgi:hypothetical protein